MGIFHVCILALSVMGIGLIVVGAAALLESDHFQHPID
jgi:hypothetical protein